MLIIDGAGSSLYLAVSSGMRNFSNIFPDFDERLLEHLLRVGEVVSISAGELFLRPGQYFKSTIVVLDGIAKLYFEGERDEELFLYFLDTGKVCALSIVRKATLNTNIKASAVTDLRLLMIPVEQMELLIRTYPAWVHFLLDAYGARSRDLLQSLYQTAFLPMDEKLLAYLRRQFSTLKTDTISTTHQQIATELNSSREVISRLLKKLEADQLISISRNEITNLSL